MKRHAAVIPVIVLAIATVLFAVACGPSSPSPSNVVQQTLDAIKAQDSETVQANYAGAAQDFDVTSMAENASGVDLSSYTEEQQEATKQLVDVVTSFDYQLGQETIDGDTATVEATITTYELGTAFTESIREYLSEALASAFSGGATDEQAMASLFIEKFLGSVSKQTEKNYSATTTFTLTKDENGAWKIDQFSEENMDAILGGLISEAQEFANSLNSLGSLSNAS